MTDTLPNMPIRVKIKIGEIEFEIEAPPEQIHLAVDKILTSVTEHQKNLNQTQPIRPIALPRAETCRGVIQKLLQENFFIELKGLEDVHSELTRRGYQYDRTAVAHALVDLARENILTRTGKPRRYQYSQKKQPC